MATGLLVYSPDGTLLTDMTRSFSQQQGSYDTEGVNGSGGMLPLPPGKSRFYAVVPLVDLNREKGKLPGVTASGNTINWAYSLSGRFGSFAANCRIYYGYY